MALYSEVYLPTFVMIQCIILCVPTYTPKCNSVQWLKKSENFYFPYTIVKMAANYAKKINRSNGLDAVFQEVALIQNF